MAKIENFEVSCKKCRSKDVSLVGESGQGYGVGILSCNNCENIEEESSN
ncbi:hypothetical protein ACRC6Q_16705 [Planococcus sp. SE5232]